MVQRRPAISAIVRTLPARERTSSSARPTNASTPARTPSKVTRSLAMMGRIILTSTSVWTPMTVSAWQSQLDNLTRRKYVKKPTQFIENFVESLLEGLKNGGERFRCRGTTRLNLGPNINRCARKLNVCSYRQVSGEVARAGYREVSEEVTRTGYRQIVEKVRTRDCTNGSSWYKGCEGGSSQEEHGTDWRHFFVSNECEGKDCGFSEMQVLREEMTEVNGNKLLEPRASYK